MRIKRNTAGNNPIQEKPATKGKLSRLCLMDVILLLCMTVVLTILLATTKVVPALYLVALAVVGLLVTVGVYFITRSQKAPKRQIAGTVLTAVLLVGALISSYFIMRTVHTIQRVASVVTEKSTVSFYTLQDSVAETLDDMAGRPSVFCPRWIAPIRMLYCSKCRKNMAWH